MSSPLRVPLGNPLTSSRAAVRRARSERPRYGPRRGNSELKGNPNEYMRLSLVSYLREQIPKKCSSQEMLPFDYFVKAYQDYKKKYGSVHKNRRTRKNKNGKRIISKTAKRGRRLYKRLLKNNLKE